MYRKGNICWIEIVETPDGGQCPPYEMSIIINYQLLALSVVEVSTIN